MTGFAPRTTNVPLGTLAVGTPSIQTTKQVARARAKIGNRGLYKFAAELDGVCRGDECSRQPIHAVPGTVVHLAREFLRILPNSAPAPMMVADPHGALTFEWTGPNERALSVVVSPDGMLVYRGRLGTRRRISGAEPLANDLPTILRHALVQVRA